MRAIRIAALAGGVLACLAGGLAAGGCARQILMPRYANEVRVDRDLAVWSERVRDSGYRFDVRLALRNRTRSFLLLRASDVQCARGRTWGLVRLRDIPDGSTVEIAPGAEARIDVACSVRGYPGAYVITLEQVLRDHRDGAAPEPLADDLVWSWPPGAAIVRR